MITDTCRHPIINPPLVHQYMLSKCTNSPIRYHYDKWLETIHCIVTQKNIPTLLRQASLALPTYVLPLNFDFASVLGLGMRYAFKIFQIYFLRANQRTERVAENNDIDVVR